jgi:hypothetical protein
MPLSHSLPTLSSIIDTRPPHRLSAIRSGRIKERPVDPLNKCQGFA